MAVKTSARAVAPTTRPATSTNVLIRRMLELPETDGPRDRLEVVLGVAEVERRGLDPLVDQVQRVLLAIADRAEDLVATPRDRHAAFGGVSLGDRHVAPGRQAFSHLPRREVEEPAGRVYVAHEIRARVLDRLIAADRPPALYARPRVLDREVEDALGAAHHLRRACQRSGLQHRRQPRAAVAGRPQAVSGGDLHVVEEHFEHLLAADRSELNSTDAAAVARHEHQAQALALAHDDGENVGDVRVLDEELAAGQA